MIDNVLVTDGAGFIGSHVADELVNRKFQVVVLDDLSGGFRENIPAGAKLVEGSITDHTLVSQLFDQYRFKYVFSLGGLRGGRS